MTDSPSWAKLRQVVIGTTTHDDDLETVRAAFGLGKGFADPEVDDIGLIDATMPVSPGRYLEFVAPADPESSFARWLTKIGGRGGYVLSVQHPDPLGAKERALAAGVRVPVDVEAFGKPVVQLHPQDMGLMLELDGITDPDQWFWDEIDPGPEVDAGIDRIVSIDVPVADPVEMNARWHHILGLGEPTDPTTVDLGGVPVRFVDGGPSAHWTVTVHRTRDDVADPGLDGITFALV